MISQCSLNADLGEKKLFTISDVLLVNSFHMLYVIFFKFLFWAILFNQASKSQTPKQHKKPNKITQGSALRKHTLPLSDWPSLTRHKKAPQEQK